VPYGTHPNPDFVGTSFMLETLCERTANISIGNINETIKE